jgi:Polyketide cyclase / dehydrase and lipid transport.
LTIIEKSIEIDASPKDVWTAILPENMPQWFEPFKEVEWTSEETHAAGSTFRVSSDIADTKSRWDAVMTEVKEDELGEWRTTSGSIYGVAKASLSPAGSGTKLSMSMDYKLPYSVIGRMFDKIRMHKELERDFEVGLADLKYLLEK